MVELNPNTTALVLIDLQKGIVGMDLQPRSGAEVVSTSKALAERFRKVKATVVLVHVGWAPDFGDAPKQPVDEPMKGPPPDMKEFTTFVDGLQQPGDLTILKHHWGAFYGTELDLQLRRRGIQTIVLGGIATNIGVESTARCAWEYGYAQVFVEEAMATPNKEMHELAFKHIFPRLGVVKKAAEIFA